MTTGSWLASTAVLAMAGVVIAGLGFLRSWWLQRATWRIEAVRLAAEVEARADTGMRIYHDLKPTIDSVFSLIGLKSSTVRDAYLAEIEEYRRYLQEAKDLANSMPNVTSLRVWPVLNLLDWIGALTKAKIQAEAIEKQLSELRAVFQSEQRDARQRLQARSPTT